MKKISDFLVSNKIIGVIDNEDRDHEFAIRTQNNIFDMLHEAKVYNEIDKKGVVVVCSTGNEGKENGYNIKNEDENGIESMIFPSDWSTTISVSAVDKNKKLFEWSNYGDNTTFCAQGYSILYNAKENSYNPLWGTSLSAPYISAACALVKVQNRNDLVTQRIIEVLKDNCEDLGEKGKDKYYGYGFVNFRTNMFKITGVRNIEVIKQPDRPWIMR